MKTKISVNKIWIVSLLLCALLFTTYNVSANTNNIEDPPPRIFINTPDCNGCGLCVEYAEMYFGLNDDGIAYIKQQPDYFSDKEPIEQARRMCPMACIFTNF